MKLRWSDPHPPPTLIETRLACSKIATYPSYRADFWNRKTMNRYAVVLLVTLLASVAGCATLPSKDAPSVRVVGLEPLPSEGLEVRFSLKLRVQNPNESALKYDGLSVNLDLDGKGLASGVTDASGEIARFSDVVLTVPVSISTFGVIRQLWARAGNSQSANGAFNQPIVYKLNGKLGSPEGDLGAIRFSNKGELDLFPTDNATQ